MDLQVGPARAEIIDDIKSNILLDGLRKEFCGGFCRDGFGDLLWRDRVGNWRLGIEDWGLKIGDSRIWGFGEFGMELKFGFVFM